MPIRQFFWLHRRSHPGVGTPIQKERGGARGTLKGLKAASMPVMIFSPNTSTAGFFAILFGVLSRKQYEIFAIEI